MSLSSNNSKKQNKKFNLIFFIDSEKTYHYKINYIFIKLIIFLLLLIIVSSITLLAISYSIIKQNISQEKYIVNFKKDLLKFYLEKNYLKDEKKQDNENQLVAINQTISTQNKDIKGGATNEQESANANTVKIENYRFVQEDSNIKVYFSLLNTGTQKTSINGHVCVVLVGQGPKGESKFIKIPSNLPTDNNSVPSTCTTGEYVKFSRLRPTEYIIPAEKSEFILKKVNVYFSSQQSQSLILNSFQ